MPQQLEGRIALVTGASRGIGRATALALAREGAHIVAVARTVGGLEEVDDEVKKLGGAATLVPLDMRDYDGFYRLAAALNERYQRLDILIGNAAIGGQRSPLDHIEPKAWDDAFAINVTANFHLIRAMAPLVRGAKAGRAVFVTSGAATNARAYAGPYSASKKSTTRRRSSAVRRRWCRSTCATIPAFTGSPRRSTSAISASTS